MKFRTIAQTYLLQLFGVTVIAVLAAFFAVQGNRALAEMIVDTEFILDFETVHSGVGTGTQRAQTFPVNTTGQLSHVDIWIKRGFDNYEHDLIVDIRPLTAGGIPVWDDNLARGTVTVAWDEVPQAKYYLNVDLMSQDISVTAGEQLALVLRSPTAPGWHYGILGSTGLGGQPSYPHGAACERDVDNPDPWVANTWDFAFRTHVIPIPEPGTATLTAIAALAIAGVVGLRHRRSSHLCR